MCHANVSITTSFWTMKVIVKRVKSRKDSPLQRSRVGAVSQYCWKVRSVMLSSAGCVATFKLHRRKWALQEVTLSVIMENERKIVKREVNVERGREENMLVLERLRTMLAVTRRKCRSPTLLHAYSPAPATTPNPSRDQPLPSFSLVMVYWKEWRALAFYPMKMECH